MHKPRFPDLSPWVLALATVAWVLAANIWANGSRMSPGNFEMGGEYGHIAVALSSGHGFSDPFGNGAGATGWMPPAFSSMVAISMLVTKSLVGTAWMLIIIKALGLGMQAWLYLGVVKRLPFSTRTASWCFAGIWALGLGFIYADAISLHTQDDWWVGLVFALIVYGFAELGRSSGRRVLAVAAGLAALSSPILLAVLAVMCGLRAFYLVRRRRQWLWAKAVKPVLPALLVATVVAGGWMIRTRVAVGVWAPIKTNGTFELWQAQYVAPRGLLTGSVFTEHPCLDKQEGERYRALGEQAYLAPYLGMFWSSVRQAPDEYFRRVFNRASNAMAITHSGDDMVWMTCPFSPDVMTRLRTLRIAMNAKEEGRMIWLHVGEQSEEDLREKLKGSDVPVDAVVHYWRLVQKVYDERNLWSHFIRGLMQAGLPMVAFLFAAAMLTGRACRWAWMSLFFYAAYLTPYVAISHYTRYQTPLQGLQALGMVLGVLAVQGLFTRRRRTTAPDIRTASV
ncbi:MAG: hypothetical protein ACAH89_02695 [Rariglobus sp.]|nr:hypothetical protein [Rariglobus sp.]